jgi:hypothetical protein
MHPYKTYVHYGKYWLRQKTTIRIPRKHAAEIFHTPFRDPDHNDRNISFKHSPTVVPRTPIDDRNLAELPFGAEV